MIKDKKLQEIAKVTIPLLKKNGIKKAGIFGSFARGESKKRSDVDILVQFPKGKSLFDLVRLEMELEGQLGRKVDLLTYKGLSPHLRDRILSDEVRII